MMTACDDDDFTEPPEDAPPLGAAVDLGDDHAVGAVHWEDGAYPGGAQGQIVDGMDCETAPDETYHVHAHLSILLNGEALAVPGEIGLVETGSPILCAYAIHTHDRSGRLHIEAPAPAVFTLGMFFHEWGQPLTANDVAGLMNLPVVIYVTDDGVTRTVHRSRWADIELLSHRLITIQIGSRIDEIPNFSWSGS
jgi:hypothetical protein